MSAPSLLTVDPNWIAASVSLLALAVSAVALWLTRRNRRSEIEQALVQQRNAINLAFADHRVKGPFAHLLKIPDAELDVYVPKACLLFLQLNLLNDFYQHRELLPKASLASYESWAERILRPWIHSDVRLVDTLKLIYATEDLLPRDVVSWLKRLMPAT